MSPEEIRLACLKLARPDGMTNTHDAALIVARARSFEDYVCTQNNTPTSLPVERRDQTKPVGKK